MRIGPAARRNLNTILIYSIMWGLGGLLFTVVERGVIGEMKTYPSTGVPYEFMNNLFVVPLMSFFGGMLLIVLDILVIDKWVRRKPFVSIILIKSLAFVLIILITTIMAGAIANTITLDRGFFSAEVWSSLWQFMGNFAFWSILIFAGFITILYLFIIEVSKSLGFRVFSNFFSGRYHRPKVEQRLFMFLDLKNSTGIAEDLGNLEYYEFLNQFFEDISPAVLHSWGTIYQYVGDEVVIHWPLSKSLESIECFFQMRQTVLNKRQTYRSRFGVYPEFRAGIHTGSVSIGEIGSLKKDILYTGDVLNATSRIQGLCKTLGVDMLCSEDVVKLVRERSGSALLFEDKGSSELRGKQEKVRLFTVHSDRPDTLDLQN